MGEPRVRALGEFSTKEDDLLSEFVRESELHLVNTGCDVVQLGIIACEARGVNPRDEPPLYSREERVWRE
jgi:hypothetical protein